MHANDVYYISFSKELKGENYILIHNEFMASSEILSHYLCKSSKYVISALTSKNIDKKLFSPDKQTYIFQVLFKSNSTRMMKKYKAKFQKRFFL